jgi:hypothetical protein
LWSQEKARRPSTLSGQGYLIKPRIFSGDHAVGVMDEARLLGVEFDAVVQVGDRRPGNYS